MDTELVPQFDGIRCIRMDAVHPSIRVRTPKRINIFR